MAESELGKAVVPVRAELGDLDKDLGTARSKIEKVLGGVATGIAGVAGGILAAGGAAAVGLGRLAMDAAPLEGIRASFQGITGDADTMLEALRKGSMGMVNDAALMQTYNQAAQLVGKTFADQLPGAMASLGKVSASTGQDMGFMLDSLVKGVGRLSPMILDNLGIQVTLADATAQAAEMFGVEESALTKAQTQAGMMAVVTEQLAANTASMPDISENASTQMTQLGVTMENLKAQVGMALLPVLQAVLGPLGELAQTYGPMLAEVFGRLAELLGPLVGGAMETLVPLVMQLLDAIIPLAETIMEQLMPAFSAILTAVIGVAGALIEGLAPVLGQVLEAILPVVVALIEMLAPILTELITRLLPVLTPLIGGIADVFGRLLMAVIPVVGTLLEELVPILLELIEQLLPPLTDILLILADIFLEYVEDFLPLFADLLKIILPIVGDLATLLAEGLSVALTALGGILEEVGKALEWLRDKVLKPIDEVLDRMVSGVSSVTEWFGKLKDKIKGLDLPAWLVPGSPTPLELGLVGIGDQLERVTGLMHGMGMGMTVEAVARPAGGGGTWNGNIVINGATDPQATANAVLRVLRDRGMVTGTALR